MTQAQINISKDLHADGLRNLSSEDFLNLGAPYMAYMKPVIVENRPGYALFAANGKLLAVQHAESEIIVLANEHNIKPLTVH